jgi:alpha-ketoglutarate-dependent taurine dioxygenase
MKRIYFLLIACSLSTYEGVTTRFLTQEERLIPSLETQMPLVIEAKDQKDLPFLQDFLKKNSAELLNDAAKYGALLFRGFDVKTDLDFENAVLSINSLRGISDAFMSEHGRERVGDLKYVLHTNTLYKTGGTLYIGGFHSENYYSPDVPSYISFCCLKPSTLGGETGLINMEKVYEHLNVELKQKLESTAYFVEKWLVSDVAKRYGTDIATVLKICHEFDLPVIGEGKDQLILMYKPSVFQHPITQKKALAINMFSLPTLDKAMRKYFMEDYPGKPWFWHRFVWKMPSWLFKSIENVYIFFTNLFHSPKELYQISLSNWKTNKAFKKLPNAYPKVDSAFTKKEINLLARLMRDFYSSSLWQKGDILLVDNRKVAHAGMPGAGPRTIRALICNLIEMKYSLPQPGLLHCEDRTTETIGYTITHEK